MICFRTIEGWQINTKKYTIMKWTSDRVCTKNIFRADNLICESATNAKWKSEHQKKQKTGPTSACDEILGDILRKQQVV